MSERIYLLDIFFVVIIADYFNIFLSLDLTFRKKNHQTNRNPMKVKDEDIIRLMQSPENQEKGLRMMMDVYQSRLYWHIRRLVNDEDAAKDVLQETFIKVYQNFSQFKKDSQLYTWLYRIASNEALQYLNKVKKMQKTEQDADVYLENQKAETSGRNVDEIEGLLQDAIQKLPEKQRMVFALRYYDDLPYEEISKILDMSVSTLKTNYHYAKSKIEQYILDHSEEF